MSSNPWIRLYRESLHDPKIVTLSDRQHRAWHNCLLITDDAGRLPPMRDIAVHMRVTVPDAEQIICELVEAELIDVDMMKGVRVFTMHGWSARQYVSDSSTGRVQKFRQRKRSETAMKRFGNDEVTPPDSDSETERDINYPSSLEPAREVKIEKSNFDGGGVRGVSVEAKRTVALALNVGNADPIASAFLAWPKSQTAKDIDAMFIASAEKIFGRLKPAARAACQPLAEIPPEPLPPVKPSSSLLNSSLVKGARHAQRVRTH